MTTNGTLKGFYEYTEEDLRNTLPNGTYCLKIREAVVGFWDDGRPRLDIVTEVVGGEFDGKFGPRHQWSLGDSDGVTADGREFHVNGIDEAKKLVRGVRAIRNGADIVLTTPDLYDATMLAEIAKQIEGDQFIATVAEDKNGYPKARRIYAMSSPPKGFKSDGVATAFNLDNV